MVSEVIPSSIYLFPCFILIPAKPSLLPCPGKVTLSELDALPQHKAEEAKQMLKFGNSITAIESKLPVDITSGSHKYRHSLHWKCKNTYISTVPSISTEEKNPSFCF